VTLTEFKFDPSTIPVAHGKVVFYLVNGGTVSHDMIIHDTTNHRVAGSGLISPGDTFVFTVDNLPAGTYTFFCDQPGHEASGMKGTLTAT
jgi:plastocyanin